MKSCHYRCEIERFVLADPDGPLELDGWILSDAAIDAVRLVASGLSLAIRVDPQADDADRRLILALRQTVGSDLSVFERAAVEVATANGDQLVFEIGHLFRPPGWMPTIVRFEPHAPDAGALADAIADGFAALDRSDDLLLDGSGACWSVTSHRYGLRFDTELDRGVARSGVRELAWPAIRDLTSGLLDAIGCGVPMIVHHATATDTDETAARLLAVIRGRNPDAVLLWVEAARAGGDVARYRSGAIAAANPAFLLASAQDSWETVLRRARDRLVEAR